MPPLRVLTTVGSFVFVNTHVSPAHPVQECVDDRGGREAAVPNADHGGQVLVGRRGAPAGTGGQAVQREVGLTISVFMSLDRQF